MPKFRSDNLHKPPFALCKTLENCPPGWRSAILAIGNFDGVHLGHRAVARHAHQLAASLPGVHPVLALTFEPHPRQLFQPDKPHFRLTTPNMQAERLAAAGFDGAMVLNFDHAFAKLSAQTFVNDILVRQLNVAGVVVGEDFHFGHARSGTPAFLREAGHQYGFEVAFAQPECLPDGRVISSSAIRTALASGDLALANRMLGDPYTVRSTVIHGAKRGRELGYPTANLRLDAANGLKHGIYACTLRVDHVTHHAVASFGRRPTFDNGAPLLEVHVFDFKADLYEKTVDIAFVAYLRPEMAFPSLEALIVQMDADSAKARILLRAADEALRSTKPLI
jgi:riboflavin kinase / FMN adenylyltransferase